MARAGQRDPALPARGDAAGDPGPAPRGDTPRAAGPGCAVVPAVDRGGRRLGPGAGPGHGRRRSGGGCWRPAGGSPWRRSSTSRATLAGAGSKRPTARTRTWRWSSAWPTSAVSRGMTSPTAWSPPASTWSVTAWPRAGSTRHRSTSARASSATSSCCPFEAAVRVAGLAAMMPAYCDVDGVPCHVSSELLTTLLRDEWGFDGLVVSDYTALNMLMTEHRLSARPGDGRRDGPARRRRCRVAQHLRVRRAAASRHRDRATSRKPSSTRPSRGRCG